MWKNVIQFCQRYIRVLLVLFVFLSGKKAVAQEVAKEVIEVSGRVSSADSGTALAGVSVQVKGGSIGTVTGEGGFFRLRVPTGSVLTFHFVGYTPVERVAGKGWSGEVRLSPARKELDEVVVVGYGTQKKTSTTAAVSTLKTADIKDAPSANISNTLNGRLAGVIAAQNGGEPGKDGAEIHIRGVATTGSNSPLVIVDGVPRDFSRLDPNTIESFTVLKDAAAVAPYGMAGANGVILVTTKKGKSGRPSLSYNGYVGYQNPTTIVKMVNAYDYVRLRNIADVNAGQAPTFTDEQLAGYKKSVEGVPDADYDKYPSTNAMDAIRNKNTLISGNNVSISGGSDNTTYYIGLGSLFQQGLWSTTNDKRYNLVSNIETKPTKTTTIGLSINSFNEIINRPSADPNAIFSTAQAWWPINAIRYSNGLEAYNNGKRILPYLTSGSRMSDQTKIMTQLSVQQDLPFIKGLNIKGVFSYDPTTYFDKNWGQPWPSSYSINTAVTPYAYTEVTVAGKPSLAEQNQRWKEYTFQGFINYHNSFGKHDVTALAVMEARKTSWDYFAASRGNYQFNIPEIDLGSSDKETWGSGGSSNQTRQVGYVYRASYAYAGKYFFEAAGRYDGHYYFAPGKRYGFFPAFSAGWRLSEESFIRDHLNWIENLKIRGSYGESGNLAGAPFQYSSAMTLAGNVYDFNGSVLQGVSERAEPNPFITWERAKKTNIGLEASLWGGLLSFTADYFYEKRNNMLVSPNSVVPVEYGIGLSQVNAGIMNNKGIDLSVSSFRSFSKDLKVSLTANFTYAKNKLVQIYENSVTLNDPNRRRTGRPLNSQFGLKAIGLFQQSDDKNKDGKITAEDGFAQQTFGDVAPGDIRYADINGDGKIDASDETYLGGPILPQIIYGFNPRVSYKGFDLSLLFQGAAQSMVQIQKELVWPFFVGANATQKAAGDYWTPDHTQARYPRLVGQGGNSNNQQNSSWWYWSSSYLRLKSAELGYTLPPFALSKIKLKSVRIYVSGLNLFTVSAVKDFFDPEMGQGGGGDNNARGWYYPQQKVVSAGLNVIF
jgi:TonB-linked SusC/RagA family outer membrane protein